MPTTKSSSPPSRQTRRTKRRTGVKMTDKELLSAIDYREQRASGGDVFEEEQRKALSYYFGELLGNETESESKLVMREVYAVIEWIKPMLMKVFFGAEKVLQFTPKSADDVAGAEQETDYVNHIVTARNDGFLIFMQWFTDAMLLKNGYVLAYWDERIDVTESIYSDVDDTTLSLLTDEDDVEILEAEEDGFDEELGVPTYRIRMRTKETVGQVRIQAVPPERVRIDGGHNSVSLKDARYVRYSERLTISELREQDFGDVEIPDDISDDGGEPDGRVLDAVRRQNVTIYDEDENDDPDPASREVDVHTLWIKVDYDGDGVAELRRVIRCGRTILYNEVDDLIALASLTPTVIAHRHQGMSIADAVLDLQEAKTMLVRGYINNIFLANNGRYFVDDDRVNMADFLVSRPGGVVRVSGGVTNAAQPFQHPVLGSTIVQAVEYLDNVLENRTGASPRVLQGQSFDGNAINKTATGINQIMSSVLARIELIARIFAETGVQDLYRAVHALSLKHARKADVVELLGKYVAVDPQQWEKRHQMTINVGVGMGDKTERVQALQMLITAQTNMMQMGLCTPKEIRNSLVKLTLLAGFRDVENFWPPIPEGQGQQPPQGQADPAAQAEAAKTEVEKAKLVQTAQLEARKIQSAEAQAMIKMRAEADKAALDQQTQLALAALKSDDENRRAGLEVEGDDGENSASPPADPNQPPQPSVQEMLAAVLAKMREGDSRPRPTRVEHRRNAQGDLIESVPIYE